MDLEQVQRLAQAFAQGVAFARGFTEMAQDAKDGEEDGHWVTIGAEAGPDGEKHGGRPVFISGSGVVKKGLSRSAQGKTLGQVFGKGGEFSSEGGKNKGETDRKAGERASTKRGEAEKARKDAASRAKEFRQETKQIVANDLEPSVAKLKKALDANVPARVHDDLVDMHRLADQIGIMANKLCSLNSRWAENSKEPSAFVVSSHGQNAKGTAERVAKLARRSAAMAHDFGKPRGERFSYGDTQVASEIRNNLSELRGLHRDLLDHIRRIQEPEKQEAPQEDPLYAARGKMINGPARANTTAQQRTESTAEKESKKIYTDKDKEVSAALKHLTNIDIPESDIKKLQHVLSNERFKHKSTISEQLRSSAVLTKRDQREAALVAYEIQGAIKDKIQKGELNHQEAYRKLADTLGLIDNLRLRTRAVKDSTQGLLYQAYHGDMPTKAQADIVEANAHTVAKLKRDLEKMARELR